MATIPIPGGNEDTWGSDLNTFLAVVLDTSTGNIKTTALDNRAFTGTINLSNATAVTLPANASIGTVSATEISYIDGLTSSAQTQLSDTSNSLYVHKADTSSHLTISQNTLIDGITVTYDKINYIANVTSDIQAQISDTSNSLYTHKIDSSAVHGITGYVVGTTDIQTLTDKTLINPIINDTSAISTTSAQINRLDNTLTSTRLLYYDEGTNRISSIADTSATYGNFITVVAGSASNADTQHTHTSLKPMRYAQQAVQAGDTINDTSSLTNFASGYLIPANTLSIGSVIKTTIYFNHSTDTSAVNFTGQLRFIYDSSAVTLGSTGVQNCTANETNQDIYITFDLVVLSLGTSGSIEAHGVCFHRNDGTGAAYKMHNLAPVTINTTVNNTLKAAWTWGTKDPLYTITQRLMLVEIYN